MTRQLTVRLPDDIVEFIDRMVEDGRGRSRAAVVAQAVDRERRRDLATRDATILAGSTDESGWDSLASHVARSAIPLD